MRLAGSSTAPRRDSANQVDTYELGTYSVSIDPDKPSGYFEAQGANEAAKNILQLNVSSPGGSGIKQVAVQAKDQNTGTVYTGGDLTGDPADGSTAYATLDPATGTYNLTVDPSVFPGRDDKITFTATPITNAGLATTVTTTASGSTEVLTPVQLGQNSNPGLVLSTNGDSTGLSATAKAGRWAARTTTQVGLPASLNGSPTSPIAPTTVATVSTQSRPFCTVSKRARKATARKLGGKTRKRSCGTLTSKAPGSEALPASYGQKLEITGTLTDKATRTSIAGGTVLIYTTDLATGGGASRRYRDHRPGWQVRVPPAGRAQTAASTSSTSGTMTPREPTRPSTRPQPESCALVPHASSGSGRTCGSPDKSSAGRSTARAHWCKCGT